VLERIHLEILTAIKEHGTLTKAADSLYLSQSALSHSIKKIRKAKLALLYGTKTVGTYA